MQRVEIGEGRFIDKMSKHDASPYNLFSKSFSNDLKFADRKYL